MKYAGFSVGGIDWLWTDLVTTTSAAERRERLIMIGHEEARLTHEMGGNLLRLFFSFGTLLSTHLTSPGSGAAHVIPRRYQGAWHQLQDDQKLPEIDEAAAVLQDLHAFVHRLPDNGDGLKLADIDAYFEGVASFNKGQAAGQGVKILLTLVLHPPEQIVEMLPAAQLAHFGRQYRFDDLWLKYVQITIRLWRIMVHRYVTLPKEDRVICAFEINNEPDYHWIPDEVRIEKAHDKHCYPINKYITELHNPQIPESQEPSIPFEPTPWGGYKDQLGPWNDAYQYETTPVLDFKWGRKFDWYVKCYADLASHMAYAVYHATRKAGVNDIDVVAAGVTHNNLDYLIRMYMANPQTFVHCTAIGLHPYHWPQHNIFDSAFRSPYDLSDWKQASPREFANKYFKRFDFFKEADRLTRLQGAESFGFAGKKIWLTEFGIPTKVVGQYNSTHPEFVPFIRPRAMPADRIPHRSVVWEDLWNAFFDQVTAADLASSNCEMIAFYTLRETAVPSFDKHDDDRSNFSLIRRDGSPRLDEDTFKRFKSFMQAAGDVGGDTEVRFSDMPVWARGKSYSTPLLLMRPWEYDSVPKSVVSTISMLTEDERRFLYWCTAHYYENKGDIVELGPFAGGSTVALAAGLRDTWTGSGRKIRSYDRFQTDSFMENYYFKPNGLQTIDGSFRNIYDAQIKDYADIVEVHEGDVTREQWTPNSPIEILFIDIAKTWEVNDHVNRTFFPHLIPGKSLVIQQDFFHQYEFWGAITMELLHDHFEYLGFVKWNSAVFRCVTPVPLDKIPTSLRDLGLETLERLLRSHIDRYSDPYLVGMLRCALIGLFQNFGNRDAMVKTAAKVREENILQPFMQETLQGFGL